PFYVEIVSPDEYQLSYNVGEKSISGKHRFADVITTPDFTIKVNRNQNFKNEEIGVPFYFVVNSNKSLKGYLSGNLSAQVLNADANTISITFKDHNAQKAREIVNTIDTVYKDISLAKSNQSTEQTLAFLDN